MSATPPGPIGDPLFGNGRQYADDPFEFVTACAEAYGEEVYEAVKSWLRERGVFWSRVHVAETSCLGLCSAEGTAIVIHPRNRWYSDVRPADVPKLLEDEFGANGSQLGVEIDDENKSNDEKTVKP